jgi:predicted Zn-dependent protease with MMP-like domain/Tfp pilus assembly protein PilF
MSNENTDSLDADLDHAWDLLERGDAAGARAIGDQLRKAVPEAPEPFMLLAGCAREDGDASGALAFLQQAAALDPEWAEPDLRAAELLSEDPEATAEALRRASSALDKAEEESEFLDAIALKAGLELDLDREEAARETLEQLPPPAAASEMAPEIGREIAHLFLALEEPATARQWLDELLKANPEDADAWHALGLAAEAAQDEPAKRRAWLKTFELDAQEDADTDERLSEAEVAEEAEQALTELPARARQLLENVPVLIADRPSRKDIEEGLDPRLLGLFAGSAYPETSSLGAAPQLTQILLFRYNLERVAADEDELREEIRTTLLHETGHFFGMDEDDLDEVGLG